MSDPLENTIQLGQWDFHEIKLEDINMYTEYIRATKYPANLWSSNFAYLWASSQSSLRKILWKVIDDMLVTFGLSYKNSLYLFCLPFGEGDPEKLMQVVLKSMNYCYDWNHQVNDRTVVRMINQQQLDYLKNCAEFDNLFRMVTFQGIERHLAIKKLVTLAGKDFSKIRNRVNKFQRENPDVIIRSYQPSDADELITLGKHWSSSAGKKYAMIFDNVYYREMIHQYDKLKQMILVFQKGQQIIGMVSGGELPTGQAWGSLLKYHEGIPGLSETLSVEFARELNKLNPKLELINIGSDLGPGGLREYKLKFRPVLNLKRYQLYLK